MGVEYDESIPEPRTVLFDLVIGREREEFQFVVFMLYFLTESVYIMIDGIKVSTKRTTFGKCFMQRES